MNATTTKKGVKGWKLRRTAQCAKCPWIKGVNPHEIPNGYSVEKHRALRKTIARQGELRAPDSVMACHETDQAHCVGWLVHQLGAGNNIGLRLQMMSCLNGKAIRLRGEQHQRFEDTLPAFGAFLGGLAKLGYGFAYRVLDAQYFGVPQRRRRVFVVGCAGGWQRAAAALFESASLQGNPPPSREKGKGIAPTIAARTKGGGGLGTDFDCDGGLIHAPEIARCVATREGTSQDWESTTMVAHSLKADGFDASEDGTGRGTPLIPVAHTDILPTMQNGADTPAGHSARSGNTKDSYIVPVHAFDARQSDVIQYGDMTGPLDTDGHTMAVAFMENVRHELRTSEQADALSTGGGKPGQGYAAALIDMQVRRLTARECDRLQGFPDDYTLVPYRGKPAADGPRYKALGNSMAVPVMRWIGERIAAVERVCDQQSSATPRLQEKA